MRSSTKKKTRGTTFLHHNDTVNITPTSYRCLRWRTVSSFDTIVSIVIIIPVSRNRCLGVDDKRSSRKWSESGWLTTQRWINSKSKKIICTQKLITTTILETTISPKTEAIKVMLTAMVIIKILTVMLIKTAMAVATTTILWKRQGRRIQLLLLGIAVGFLIRIFATRTNTTASIVVASIGIVVETRRRPGIGQQRFV